MELLGNRGDLVRGADRLACDRRVGLHDIEALDVYHRCGHESLRRSRDASGWVVRMYESELAAASAYLHSAV